MHGLDLAVHLTGHVEILGGDGPRQRGLEAAEGVLRLVELLLERLHVGQRRRVAAVRLRLGNKIEKESSDYF